MVVAEKDAVGVIVQSGFHHEPRICGYLAQGSFGNPPAPQHTALGIDADDPESFDPTSHLDLLAEVFQLTAVGNLLRILHFAFQHNPGDRQHHGQECCLLLSDPPYALQLLRSGLEHAFQIPEGFQQVFGRVLHVFPGRPESQQQLQHLMVAEALEALILPEALPQPRPVPRVPVDILRRFSVRGGRFHCVCFMHFGLPCIPAQDRIGRVGDISS